jgi:hypothetical protein
MTLCVCPADDAATEVLTVKEPVSIAVNSKGNVLVVCRNTAMVRMFSRHGLFLRCLQVGPSSAGNPVFVIPEGV